MLSFRDLVDARLDALGLQQKDLAMRLGTDPARLSKVMVGRIAVPIEEAPQWAAALNYAGVEAEQFVDAMHIAAASERVHALVDALRTQVVDLTTLLERYRSRVGEARFLLDHAEPVGATTRVMPGADVNAVELLRLIADLAASGSRAPDDQVRRVAEGDAPRP